MENKTCNTCGEAKPLSEFYLTRGKPGGKRKRCYRAVINRSNMQPKPLDADGLKRCTLCKERKPPSAFSRSKNYGDGLDPGCKTCRYARYCDYAKKNRAKLSADELRRYRANPARYMDYERKKHYGMPHGAYAVMLEAQGGRCAICGTDSPLRDGTSPSITTTIPERSADSSAVHATPASDTSSIRLLSFMLPSSI